MENKKNIKDYSLSNLGIKLSTDQDELLTRFFAEFYNQELDLSRAMALDLYRAISCFRYYKDVSVFIKINPEAEEYREEVESLWEEFKKLSSEELAEIAIKALEEI